MENYGNYVIRLIIFFLVVNMDNFWFGKYAIREKHAINILSWEKTIDIIN